MEVIYRSSDAPQKQPWHWIPRPIQTPTPRKINANNYHESKLSMLPMTDTKIVDFDINMLCAKIQADIMHSTGHYNTT